MGATYVAVSPFDKPPVRGVSCLGLRHDTQAMRILQVVQDVTPEIEQAIEDCMDWFWDEPLTTQDFIDRLAETYGGQEWDIESYDNPAVRRIMGIARKLKREAQ